jgi:hypothetical protein
MAPWREGFEPGRQVAALGLALVMTVVAVDLALVGKLSLFFDLCFIVVCLGLAALVHPADFFLVGVLPPLIMVGVFTVLAMAAPGTLAEHSDGVVQAVVSGLATHSGALFAGYALCLTCLALRKRFADT